MSNYNKEEKSRNYDKCEKHDRKSYRAEETIILPSRIESSAEQKKTTTTATYPAETNAVATTPPTPAEEYAPRTAGIDSRKADEQETDNPTTADNSDAVFSFYMGTDDDKDNSDDCIDDDDNDSDDDDSDNEPADNSGAVFSFYMGINDDKDNRNDYIDSDDSDNDDSDDSDAEEEYQYNRASEPFTKENDYTPIEETVPSSTPHTVNSQPTDSPKATSEETDTENFDLFIKFIKNNWFTIAFILFAFHLCASGGKDNRQEQRQEPRQAVEQTIKHKENVANDDNLPESYKKGLEYERTGDTRALGCYIEAYNAGCDKALYHIGYMYETGFGVSRNLYTAKLWYEKAAQKNDPRAAEAIKRVEQKEREKKNR